MTAAEAVAAARGRPPDAGLGRLAATADLGRPPAALPGAARWTSTRPTSPRPAGRSSSPPTRRPRSAPPWSRCIAHRRTARAARPLKVLEYRPGEADEGLAAAPRRYTGSVAPTRVPYYVTAGRRPGAIPFEFQYLLDVEYAVGRLAFDRPEQYRQYAESVVAYETAAAVPNAREVVYWGTRHAADRATQIERRLPGQAAARACRPRPASERSRPSPQALGSARAACSAPTRPGPTWPRCSTPRARPPPGLAVHRLARLGWPQGHERQLAEQGALLCQDWPGFGIGAAGRTT